MKKGPGYELWFGRHKGKTVEQLMFIPGGPQYLSWVVTGMQNSRYERLVARIQEVRARGKTLPRKGKCQCEEGKAHFFSVSTAGYDLGISPFHTYCYNCRDRAGLDAQIYQLNFEFASMFEDPWNREAYSRVLKYAFFGDSKKIVTKKRAFELFYPERSK